MNGIRITDQATFNRQITGMHAENWVCRQSLKERRCMSMSGDVNPTFWHRSPAFQSRFKDVVMDPVGSCERPCGVRSLDSAGSSNDFIFARGDSWNPIAGNVNGYKRLIKCPESFPTRFSA
jgi:hypothetical protein